MANLSINKIAMFAIFALIFTLGLQAQSPRELKKSAIDILDNITINDPKVQSGIDSAILSIEQSLVSKGIDNFIDDFRVAASTGKAVFSNSSKAASTISKIIASNIPQEVKDSLQQALDFLVQSDKDLANIAIQTAQKIVGVLQVDAKSLGSALAEFTKGQQEPDAAKAIKAFAKAWQFSQKAIPAKLDDLVILNFNDTPDPFVLGEQSNTLEVLLEMKQFKAGSSHLFRQTIKDANGNIVRTLTLEEVIFPRSLKVSIKSVWDGKDDQGVFVAPGIYSYTAFSQLTNDSGKVEQISFPISGEITVIIKPNITSIDPTSGLSAGGTSITITGSFFVEGATVLFGNDLATNIEVVNSTTITCDTPAKSSAEVVDVTVQNLDNQSDTLSNAFTYTDIVFFVVSSTDNNLDIIHQNGSIIEADIPVGNAPGGVGFGDGVFVVTNFDDDTIDILDPDGTTLVDGKPVGNGPIGVAFGDGVFVIANSNEGTVDIIDSSGNILVDGKSVGGGAFGVAFGDGVFVVTNQGDDTIHILDASGNILVDGLAVGDKPLGVAFGDGVFMLANSNDNTVDILDASGNILVDGLAVGNNPEGVAFGDGVFMVVNLSDDTVDIIDSSGTILVDGQAVGDKPEDVAFGGGVFMVTNVNDDSVDILDSDGNTIVDGQPVGNSPDGVASSDTAISSRNQRSKKEGVYWESRFKAESSSEVVHLSWKNIGINYIGYNIWRKTNNEKTFQKINGLIIVPENTEEMNNYQDINVDATNTSYFYKIEYVKPNGEGEFTHTTFLKSNVERQPK